MFAHVYEHCIGFVSYCPSRASALLFLHKSADGIDLRGSGLNLIAPHTSAAADAADVTPQHIDNLLHL